MRLKYLILETPYIYLFLYIQLVVLQLYTHLLPITSPMFQHEQLFFFGFSNLSFFVFVFATLKKKIFIFKYFWHCSNSFPSQTTLVSQTVFCDYQINLGINSSLQGGRYSIFLARGETLYGGPQNFIGGLDNLLETMLYDLTLISL